MKFDRVVCVSLKRRPERWQRFINSLPADWPFGPVEQFAAIDGKNCPSPDWWTAGNPAWGCYKSHLNILEQCLNNSVNSCLFLEDDAVCCEDFSTKIHTFFDHIPVDWEMLYLGGQHLFGRRNPPIKMSKLVYIPYNVNRTHAFALRGKNIMRSVYRHLNAATDWHKRQHIDHHLGRLHQRFEHKIYCPNEWLVGQREGRSDISWKQFETRFFPAASSFEPVPGKFVVVMGLHRSGSSCLAMMLHKLGVHMGNRLTGYEHRNGGGGEAAGLAAICESAMPFPSARLKCWEGTLRANLLEWIRSRVHEANRRNTIAGGKYPHLCAWGSWLESVLQGNLLVIHADRPLEESIESLVKREPHRSSCRLKFLQQNLWDLKHAFLQSTNVPVLNVRYSHTLENPGRVVKEITDFLQISANADQVDSAMNHPQDVAVSGL